MQRQPDTYTLDGTVEHVSNPRHFAGVYSLDATMVGTTQKNMSSLFAWLVTRGEVWCKL